MNILRNLVFLLALQCLSMQLWAIEGSQNDIEYRIKAAFLYKFASYVDWPPSAFPDSDTPLTIGVIDAEEIQHELETLSQGNRINNRVIRIKRITGIDSLENVQILFIGRKATNRLPSLLSSALEQPILTVTESRGALDVGSVINFIPVNDNIRFEVSVASAELCGIKISARLLDVAQRIKTGGP